jgi:hypothetical protein
VSITRAFSPPSRRVIDGEEGGDSIFYSMNKALRFMKMLLSFLHSSAREDETLDCHQIVTKAGAKRAKIGELQKTEIRSI